MESTKPKKKTLDIPSSNFISDMGKKTSKYAPSFDFMKSVPSNGLKHADPNKILQSLPLEQKYREVLGPDNKQMQKLEVEKAKKEQALKKLALQASTINQPKTQTIQIGVKPIQVSLKEEEADAKAIPTNIYLEDDGKIVDKDGKAVHVEVNDSFTKGTVQSSIDINRMKNRENKIKQLLKLQKDSETQEQTTGKLFDSLIKSNLKKRDRKSIGALQFVVPGSIVEKAESIRNEEQLKRRGTDGIEDEGDDLVKLSRVLRSTGIKKPPAKTIHNVDFY